MDMRKQEFARFFLIKEIWVPTSGVQRLDRPKIGLDAKLLAQNSGVLMISDALICSLNKYYLRNRLVFNFWFAQSLSYVCIWFASTVGSKGRVISSLLGTDF